MLYRAFHVSTVQMKACTIIKLNGHASFITSELEEGLWPVAFLVRWVVPIMNRWVDVPTDRDVRGKGIRPCRESNRDYRFPNQLVLWILLTVPQGQVLQICGHLVFKVQITGGRLCSPISEQRPQEIAHATYLTLI